MTTDRVHDARYANLDIRHKPMPTPRDRNWLARLPRENDGSINLNSVIEKQADAIEAMEVAADVHPLGPSIIILKSKKLSFRQIATVLHVCHTTVENIHKRIAKAVGLHIVTTLKN